MVHSTKSKNFNRTTAHQRSMFRGLVKSYETHGFVETTLPKAKRLKSILQSLNAAAKSEQKVRLVRTRFRVGDNAEMAKVISSGYLENKFKPKKAKKNAKTN